MCMKEARPHYISTSSGASECLNNDAGLSRHSHIDTKEGIKEGTEVPKEVVEHLDDQAFLAVALQKIHLNEWLISTTFLTVPLVLPGNAVRKDVMPETFRKRILGNGECSPRCSPKA